jgi:hypothetical protein
LELLAAVSLLVPRITFHSTTLLAMVMVSALFAHAAVLGIAMAIPAFIRLVLNVAISYFRLRPVVDIIGALVTRRGGGMQPANKLNDHPIAHPRNVLLVLKMTFLTKIFIL